MKTITLIGLVDEETTRLISQKRDHVSKLTGSKAALADPPHFSLRNNFQVENRLDDLVENLEELARNSKPLHLQLHDYGFYPQWHVAYINIIKSNPLQKLHSAAMTIIQNFRTPWVDAVLLANKHYTWKQQDYVVKYGYQFAFEFYSPHITVAGADMSNEAFLRLKAILEKERLVRETTFSSFVLIDRDNQNRIYHKFSLSG